MSIREIKTQGLSLRPFTLADVDMIHQLWIEPGIRKYLWDDEIIPKEKTQVVIAKSIELFSEIFKTRKPKRAGHDFLFDRERRFPI